MRREAGSVRYSRARHSTTRGLAVLAVAACLLAGIIVAGCGSSAASVPVLSSISPASGQSGTRITLKGKSFGSTQSGGSVRIGTQVVSVKRWSDTQIEVEAPPGLADASYFVSVFTRGGSSKGLSFTVKSVAATPPQGSQSTQPTQPSSSSSGIQTGRANNTPQDALKQSLQAQGQDPSSWDFVNSKASNIDPAWAVFDYQKHEGTQHMIFLEHLVNGTWTVLISSTEPINPVNYGAPADLTYP